MSEIYQSRGERTREEILSAALQLFIDRGYHGTSMRQIARQAGIALGGIYNHFSSKEEIFFEVLMAYHPMFDVLPALKDAQGETVEEIIHHAANLMVSKYEERLDFINLMFIEMVEFKGQHIPQLFDIAFPQVMAFAERALGDRPELRSIPMPILMRAFIGLFFSYMITEILIGRQLPPESQENSLNYLVDIYLHGVMRQAL